MGNTNNPTMSNNNTFVNFQQKDNQQAKAKAGRSRNNRIEKNEQKKSTKKKKYSKNCAPPFPLHSTPYQLYLFSYEYLVV